MAKTKIEKTVDAGTTLGTALNTYITTVTAQRGGSPDAIEGLITNLLGKANNLKHAIEVETDEYLKQAKKEYTANTAYTAEQKKYINSKV